MIDGSPRELWGHLCRVREQIDRLKLVEDDLEQQLADKMNAKDVELEGIGILRKQRTTSRQWDRDALLTASIQTLGPAAWYEETGHQDLPEPLSGFLSRFVGSLGKVLSVGYGKVQGLTEAGLDADEFSQTTYGGWKVRRL